MTSEPSGKSVEELVLDGVNKGLDSIGANVKDVFYSVMESSYQLKRTEIAKNPDQLERAISGFFTVGAALVDRTIGREVVRSFNIPLCPALNFKTGT
jgi:hypothetical protein